jgi:hypothetical protein
MGHTQQCLLHDHAGIRPSFASPLKRAMRTHYAGTLAQVDQHELTGVCVRGQHVVTASAAGALKLWSLTRDEPTGAIRVAMHARTHTLRCTLLNSNLSRLQNVSPSFV